MSQNNNDIFVQISMNCHIIHFYNYKTTNTSSVMYSIRVHYYQSKIKFSYRKLTNKCLLNE